MYDVYFDRLLLPVAPSKIKTEINNSNKTVNLINEGEVNILKDPGLTEISFEILLPNVKYPFAKYSSGFKKASYYLDVFENYQKNKKPFQFIISRTLPGGSVLFYTNMKMSMEGYDIVDDVSEGFDITVNIKMKQYKAYGTKTTDISAYVRKSASTRDGGQNNAGKKYKIVSGDTLWGIAKRFLGKGSRWTEIYNANKSIIESAAKKHGKSSSSNGHWI
ncbi:MAG: LysM peptidoglycan-binding domain-containing protein, partial [Lachnospiraceae bacterium]